ncbi:imidazole glycerol phosphate synthase subunit HisF [Flavisolibacter sp. BT320]|nr:imidazole glycerol phosphate synthase subunit HisF [Flavisolibacter longurius]
MLKKRIAAAVVVKDGIVVQSIGFKKYLPVGKPGIAIEFLNRWGIDEIIYLDISASRKQQGPDYEQIKMASQKCFVPLTVGGGITNIDEIKELMHCGADKISLNQSAIRQPSLIKEAAHIFGDQCVVVSIDAVRTNDGYRVFDYINHQTLNETPAAFAQKAQELGAGEIFINSVDQDGSYAGFDLELINSVCEVLSVPVICCGGARNASDFVTVLQQTKASGACAANFFHFTENSVNISKAHISKVIPIRLETHASYQDNNFDNELRLLKKSEDELERMLYVKIEKEEI